jgi:hypothetical protein
MEPMRNVGLPLIAISILLAGCQSNTAPRLPPDPEEEEKKDTVPETGSVMPPPVYFV